MPEPTIITNPPLGLTESVEQDSGKRVVDNRSANRGLPYLHPETNLPVDDAHRVNHLVKMVDEDLDALETASLLGIEPMLLLSTRRRR